MEDATILDRGIALLFDGIFIFSISLVVSYLIPGWSDYSSRLLTAVSAGYITAAISPAYFILLEGSKGYTPGKSITGLEVTDREGNRIGYFKSAVRNLLRPVDAFPFLWLTGIVSIIITEQNQRVGDLAAGTKVVRH